MRTLAQLKRSNRAVVVQKTTKQEDTRRLYQTKAWLRASRVFLREHPMCVQCEAPAWCTDHIEPHRGDIEKFWDLDNWQAMCRRCHAKKSRSEMALVERTP